ncbi:uncharacterized protein C2orf80-like isoform X3 [Denticeps clupeoides]|uniref:uncharacterized protein C2orf80-like isoform X3 n=1 Tax=Denticeps clupeoides TaxID=299321 RepID=UPI0010A3090E|nr:uncharacterized protein C2orf80-like isoform X3 [Denticeps clupeoides]
METRRLRRNIEALLGDYVGQKLRENGFDPKGKREPSTLDDLAHYDLAINVALWWLNRDGGPDDKANDIIGIGRPRLRQHPSMLEREAMILSSFAGMVLNSLPVKDILSLYNCKPSASYPDKDKKSVIIHPFTLSHHPFAMLSSFRAIDHSRKHTEILEQWSALRSRTGTSTGQNASTSSSTSQSSFRTSTDSLKDQLEDSRDTELGLSS